MTEDDVRDLARWAEIFGGGFEPALLFLFWCDAQPPDALFQEVFEFERRWYAIRVIRLEDYRRHMRPRSARWQTVALPRRAFEDCSRTLADML